MIIEVHKITPRKNRVPIKLGFKKITIMTNSTSLFSELFHFVTYSCSPYLYCNHFKIMNSTSYYIVFASLEIKSHSTFNLLFCNPEKKCTLLTQCSQHYGLKPHVYMMVKIGFNYIHSLSHNNHIHGCDSLVHKQAWFSQLPFYIKRNCSLLKRGSYSVCSSDGLQPIEASIKVPIR